jgi:hypothetical protein
VELGPKEHTVNLVANISTLPKEGKIFEGSLADGGGSGYKLSLGEFLKNGTLDYTATMANPYTYTQFLVTRNHLKMQILMLHQKLQALNL